jgi:hypothetical protein
MCNVRISHDEAVVAYFGHIAVDSSPVNGHTFSYGGVIAYNAYGILSLKLKVLWYGRYNGAGKNAAVLTYARAFHYSYV